MNIKKRIISTSLAAVMCAGSLCLTSGAAGEVADINGTKTVFVTAFGRMSYDGKARNAYTNMDEAVAALGETGGRLVLQGNASPTSLGKTGKLVIEGMGQKATGNVITLESDRLTLSDDLTVSMVTFQMPENAIVVTGDNTLTAYGGFDSYFKEQYSTSGNTITYPAPISVASGDFDGSSDSFLYSGTYKNVSAGISGSSGKGDANIIADGVSVENVFAGAPEGKAELNGNIFIGIGASSIGTLGDGNGTVDGNVIVNVSAAANIEKYDDSGDLSVSGRKVLISDADEIVPEGMFDTHIKLSEGNAYAVTDGKELRGLRFADKNGLDTKKIIVDGVEKTSENGIFDIPAGVASVTVIPTIEIRLSADGALVAGYEDGTFLPQNNMTRAEAITVLSRLITDESVFSDAITSDYPDVSDDAWYSPYIGLFEKLGYLDSLEAEGNILPDAKITRAEFCELIFRIYPLVSTKMTGIKEFSDVSADHPYYNAVSLAGFVGIVGGYEDGTFRPEGLITRAEVVTMINRMIGRTPAENSVTIFSDTVSHWAKGQINAAASPAEKDGVTMWTKESTNKYDEYMQYRSSLTNTRLKLQNEKKLNVAFIGGSVTAGAGASSANETSWRARTVEWFEKTYPDCEINQVNAAIGDSYTKYAVYRMDNDLLKYDYDILFVEYAINDSPWYSAKQDTETIIYFETLIRRVYEHNPKADIVIVYTFDDKLDRTQKYFPTAAAQEVIAQHYDIPSVNFGRALADHIAENDDIEWNDCFADYVHPNDRGYLYYAAVVTEYLENALSAEKCGDAVSDRTLPAQHTDKKLWYDLTMLEAAEIDLSLSKNWALSEDGTKIYPTDAENELVIKTYGSDICIAAPRDDVMYYSVDGGAEQQMKMNRKPQTLFEGLSEGEHILRIRAEDITSLSIQRVMYNGKKQ